MGRPLLLPIRVSGSLLSTLFPRPVGASLSRAAWELGSELQEPPGFLQKAGCGAASAWAVLSGSAGGQLQGPPETGQEERALRPEAKDGRRGGSVGPRRWGAEGKGLKLSSNGWSSSRPPGDPARLTSVCSISTRSRPTTRCCCGRCRPCVTGCARRTKATPAPPREAPAAVQAASQPQPPPVVIQLPTASSHNLVVTAGAVSPARSAGLDQRHPLCSEVRPRTQTLDPKAGARCCLSGLQRPWRNRVSGVGTWGGFVSIPTPLPRVRGCPF
nr:uncharacterized protein LOC123282403 [Equus asinus]